MFGDDELDKQVLSIEEIESFQVFANELNFAHPISLKKVDEMMKILKKLKNDIRGKRFFN